MLRFHERLQNSLTIYQKSLENIHKQASENNGRFLEIETLLRIGQLYIRMRDNNKSLEFLNISWELNLKNTGENHPSASLISDSIGSIYFSMGQYKKSLEFYEKALEISRKEWRE